MKVIKQGFKVVGKAGKIGAFTIVMLQPRIGPPIDVLLAHEIASDFELGNEYDLTFEPSLSLRSVGKMPPSATETGEIERTIDWYKGAMHVQELELNRLRIELNSNSSVKLGK